MVIWLQEFGMQLLLWLLGLIDSLFAVFGSVAGIQPIMGDNGSGIEEMSLGEYFINLDGVQKAFWIVLIASVGICAVCTVVAIVKNIVNMKGGEPKSHAKTVGQAMGTVFVAIFMGMFFMVGIAAADGFLGAVNTAINDGEQMTMSREIINISVQGGYVYDYDNVLHLNEYDEDGNPTFISYKYKFEEDGTTGKPKFYINDDNPYLPVLLKPDGSAYEIYKDIYKEKLDPVTGEPEKNAEGYTVYEIKDVNKLVKEFDDGETAGWVNGHNKGEISADIWSVSVRDLFGTHKDGMIFPSSWRLDGMINPDNFNFLVAYLCAVIVLVAIVGATLGLVKKLFDLVLLFIVLPGISATIPLDDGAKFKLWRETAISKVFLAFGSVFAVNVFFIVAPMLWSVTIPGVGGFTNAVLRLVLICGGALTISGGQLLFSRLLGTSAEEGREMGQSARTLFGGAMTALGGAKAAGRLLFGAKNANGQRVGGLVKGGASAVGSIGGGAVNAVGGAVGGQAYRNSKFGQGVSATQKALKGFGQSSGWLGQDRSTGGNTLGGAIGSGAGKLGSKFASSGFARNTGLNNGIAGGISAARNERAASARSKDIAAAFGVNPHSVKHVSYGRQAAEGTSGVGVGSANEAPDAARSYNRSKKGDNL